MEQMQEQTLENLMSFVIASPAIYKNIINIFLVLSRLTSKLLQHRTCFYSPFRPFEQGPFLRASNAERSYKETLDYYCNDAKTRKCKLALSKMQLLINVLKGLSIMLPIRNFLYGLKVIMIYKTVSL